MEMGNLTPGVLITPELMATKFGVGDDIGDIYPCAKFHYDPMRGFCSRPASPRSRRQKFQKATFPTNHFCTDS